MILLGIRDLRERAIPEKKKNIGGGEGGSRTRKPIKIWGVASYFNLLKGRSEEFEFGGGSQLVGISIYILMPSGGG